MRRTRRALRGPRNVALLSLGALAVHQTTYLLAADADLHAISEHTRHSYLAELTPALIVAALASIAISLLAAARRRWRIESSVARCTTDRAGLYAAALLAVYLGQELGEARLARACPARSERAPRSTGSAVAGARRPLASSPLAFGLSRRRPPLALARP